MKKIRPDRRNRKPWVDDLNVPTRKNDPWRLLEIP
jgi:hypothetical protein